MIGLPPLLKHKPVILCLLHSQASPPYPPFISSPQYSEKLEQNNEVLNHYQTQDLKKHALLQNKISTTFQNKTQYHRANGKNVIPLGILCYTWYIGYLYPWKVLGSMGEQILQKEKTNPNDCKEIHPCMVLKDPQKVI